MDFLCSADPLDILAAWNADTPTTRESLIGFVSKWFGVAGSDSEPAVPSDWHPEPPLLVRITNTTLREWALGLHSTWLMLTRRTKASVLAHPERNSLLYLPHEYIQPGQRFTEIYNWDSYFIVRGLLRCRRPCGKTLGCSRHACKRACCPLSADEAASVSAARKAFCAAP